MTSPETSSKTLSSYSTACVFLPAASLQSRLNAIRVVHDKAGTRWPAHFTALFPFVEPAHLVDAAAHLQAAVSHAALEPFSTTLDHVDAFTMRGYKTVYLAPSPAASVSMQAAWKVAACAFRYSGRAFVPHLTLGQTPHTDSDFLTTKGEALIETGLQWETSCFVFLLKDEVNGGRMKIAHVVDFQGSSSTLLLPPPDHFPAYALSPTTDSWIQAPGDVPCLAVDVLRFASYNILEDERFPFASRAASVVTAILESHADMIGLQEISATSLRYLLAASSLRDRGYLWCTHHPSTVFPLHRNIVILSKVPFASWTVANLGDRLKPAVLLSMSQIAGRTLTLVAVHLSAGYSSEISEKRAKELDTLSSVLCLQHADHDWVVLGDTNLQSSDSDPDCLVLVDAWEQCGSLPELEASFEPEINSLAAQTSLKDNSSKRYDRIFVRNARFILSSFTRFGLPSSVSEAPASDHWGVAVSLKLGTAAVALGETPERDTVSRLPLVPTTLTDSELLDFAEHHQLVPHEADLGSRKAAMHAVSWLVCSRADDTLTGTTTVCLKLAPVGSFALGVSVPDSDVDCVAVGNISSDTFWELIRSRLRTIGWPNPYNVRLRRFVKEATVRMMELAVGGIKVDMQYCAAPRVAESWDSIATLPSNTPVFSLPLSSLRTLNAYRDSLALHAIIPAELQPAFRLAHRCLRRFCERRGIFSSKHGYFGSFHLSILLARLLSSLPPSVTASQLVRMFVAHYSSWNWASDAVYVGQTRDYARTGREAMVILSPERPSFNVSSSATRSTVRVITGVLADAERLLAEGASWVRVCGPGLVSFLSSHERFAKIDVTYWGTSSMTGRGLVGHLESRLVHLLVQLQTALPALQAHLWPKRLSDSTSTDIEGSLQAFYLIGLSGSNLDVSIQTRLALLEAFADDIRDHARYYDAANSFVYASEVTSYQLGVVSIDSFSWPDGGTDEVEGEETDEDEARAGDDFARGSEFALLRRNKGRNKMVKKVKSKHDSKSPPPNTTAVTGTMKLRSSADVYNRLMWDSGVSREDYLIGYEDRFKGLKEMPLSAWKREVEDEAFIPFHRVVHFRRRSDNVIVWDRAKRVDLLFGSGSSIASSS